MLIRQANIVSIALLPSKKDAVLLIDSDAVLSLSMVLVFLKVIARNYREIA